MKLRLKVLLYIILSTSIIFILSVGYINYKYWNYTRDMAIQLADLYAKQSAIRAESILTADMKTVSALENVFLGYNQIDKEERKDIYEQILMNVLEKNNNFLAVWMSWELQAVDDNWDLPYGRERSQCFWDSGLPKIKIDSLDLDGDQFHKDYYKLKSGGEECLLTNPYFFSYTSDTGSTVLETSIAKGIFDGDRYVGAVGVDVSLQRFQTLLRDLKPYKNSYILIVSNDGTIVANFNESFQGQEIDKMYPEFNRFEVKEKITTGQEFSFFVEDKEISEKYVSFFPIQIEGSSMPWSLGFIVSTDVIVENIRKNSLLLVLLSGISILFISLIIWVVLSQIVGPIEKTTKTLESLSIGNARENLKVSYSSKDELGRMAIAVNLLIDSLVRTQIFAQEIGKGNLKTEYDLAGKNDVLGQSLIEMRDNLLKAQEEEIYRSDESKRMSWMQNGITDVNEILREKSDNIINLSSELVKFLVNYTKSVQGGLYLIEKKDGIEYIVLKAAYAYDRKKEMKSKLEIGEGLIGRVVKEKKPVAISNLPEGYLFVRSGLGEKSPQNLVIIPLIFEDAVLGAFELASFNNFTEHDIDFLQQIAVRITSSVSVLLKNVETSNLLKESQLQTATFEMKERQFMRQRKKLSEKQQDLELQSKFLGVALDAIKTLGLYLELDEEQNILDTNDFLLKEFEIQKEEIVGKNIASVTKVAQTATLWLSKFWEDILSGQTRKKLTTYIINDKEIEITDTYFLVNTGDSKKIIVVGYR
ncbi:MAG: GAF domain-containing protein [Bacteroidales bacterium]|nr:GAF domain-containing protein [Bacteroidales bacterium]